MLSLSPAGPEPLLQTGVASRALPASPLGDFAATRSCCPYV